MRASLLVATVIALVPLVLVIYYLLKKGFSSWSSSFFTSDPNGNFFGNPGGVRSAILGTLEIVGLATLISVPIGIGVALYLTEYGKQSRIANVVRYFIDVMTGVPSIMFGLFIYIVLVLAKVGGTGFAGWKGSVALALLMLPIVIRSAEVVLLLVPGSLREAALALGAPRWRVVTRVVLPTARTGLVTGSLLAVARGMGETAPLLFTTAGAFAVTVNLRPADERAAAADLQRHPLAPGRGRQPGVGRRADAGGARPDPQRDRPRHLSKEPHGMIPPDTTRKSRTTSKEPTDMSMLGAHPSKPRRRLTSRRSALARAAGHAVRVKDLHAYYGKQQAIKGVDIEFPPNEVTRDHRPVGMRQVDDGPLHQPHARGDPGRAGGGQRRRSTSSTSTRPGSTSRPCAA